MERRAGYTMFELMIVVTVLALIAAFAIPSLMTSLKGGKEASAISSLRTLSSVNEQYNIRFGTYPNSLGTLTATGYIDGLLGSGTKSGYTFNYSATRYTWTCGSSPQDAGVTGDRFFFVDESGVIRVNPSAPATSTDAPIN